MNILKTELKEKIFINGRTLTDVSGSTWFKTEQIETAVNVNGDMTANVSLLYFSSGKVHTIFRIIRDYPDTKTTLNLTK